jgi:hypothetical protein
VTDHYLDISGTEGIRLNVRVKLEGQEVLNEPTRPPIPEEYMDRLRSIVGDGNATVTVGLDAKTGEYSNSAGASAFVKLTCGQNEESVEAARQLAEEIAVRAVESGKRRADIILAGAMGQPVPEDAPHGPIKNLTPTKALADIEERSQASIKPRVSSIGKGKPSFKR